jgi:hypothetical protein
LPSISQTHADLVEIRRGCDIFCEPGEVYELRVLNAGRDGTVAGYFDDRDAMVQAAAHWSGKAPGVYRTLNPVNPALLARADNRVKTRARETTTDADIIARKWIFIDADAVRPSGISASDEEHELALGRMRGIRLFLLQEGWPEPVLVDSGNGGHLYFRLSLRNDDASHNLVQRVLQALARRFNDDRVKIDETVHNAARIVRMPGTLTGKGDHFNGRPNLDRRPHRLARFL